MNTQKIISKHNLDTNGNPAGGQHKHGGECLLAEWPTCRPRYR